MSEPQQQLQERIKQLIPINELPANLQSRLLQRAQILEVKKSRFIFKQGNKDDYSYYLLDGEIELYADKKLEHIIQSNTDRSRYALSQLQPRQFSAKAKTVSQVLQIDRNTLDQLMILAQETTDGVSGGGGGTTVEVDEVDDNNDWMTRMLQSELFSRIPTANTHQLFASLESVNFKAGDIVIRQGDPGEHYYIISEGKCAVFRKSSPKSSDVRIAELKVGDSFGEEALISDSTRNATVTMITDGVLMQLAKDMFVELVKNPTLQSLNFDEAEALVDEGSAKWLDVRFPNEHRESSIEDSLNIPLNALRLQTDELADGMIYILYCDTGSRSSTGAFLLAERGHRVSYLSGGLVNNPEAVGVETKVPKKQPDSAEPVEAHVEKLNAELEKTQIRMANVKAEKAGAESKHAVEEKQRELEQEKKQLEARKRIAEAEAKKKARKEEARLKKLQAQSEKRMRQERKNLEEIYNKNVKDMEKLQRVKQATEEKIRKQREALEKQAEEAREQVEKVEVLKRKLEQEAERKRLELEARERDLQQDAKIRIEEERKRLAEKYAQSTKEFEALKRQREEAESARLAAKKDAQRMLEEYKQSHDESHTQTVAGLTAEQLRIEQEVKKLQESMKQIQQAKLEKQKQEKQELRVQIEEDLQKFEEDQEEEADSITQVQRYTDMMQRIKLRAADAKHRAEQENSNLLSDISNQLDDK